MALVEAKMRWRQTVSKPGSIVGPTSSTARLARRRSGPVARDNVADAQFSVFVARSR